MDRFAYRPLREGAPPGPPVSAIGVSFVFLNLGLFWGGNAHESVLTWALRQPLPKDFPSLVSNTNLLGSSVIQFTAKDLLVLGITIPLMIGLTVLVKFTRPGQGHARGWRRTPRPPV